LIPVGIQRIIANSTAQAINTTCRPADVLLFSVETAGVRFRMDAAATGTTGVLYSTGGNYWIHGWNRTSLAVFKRATTTSAIVTVQTFREA
jgi:hypothetical protein